MRMAYSVGEILLSREQIAQRVRELGDEVSAAYEGRNLVVVGILKGAVVFLSDLVRTLRPQVEASLDFMAVSSYGASTKTTGAVKILKDLDTDIRGKHVLVVEDIVDTGLTLSYLLKILEEREPESLAACALLDKPERRQAPVAVRFCGFSIPDEFVVGYGLDCGGRWRHLPDIHKVETTD